MKLLITTLLLPLGLVLGYLLWLVVRLWQRRHEPFVLQNAYLWALAPVVFLWVMSLPVVGHSLAMILLNQVTARDLDNPGQVQAIVVLTGGMTNAGPLGWMPKPAGIHRLAVAYELQRIINLRVPVIISGGFTEGGENPSEARVTADFFARYRSELTPTELEETSQDTFESAMQLAPVLAKREAHTILLVTSDVHMWRALATFRARGIDAIPAPALSLATTYQLKDWLPSAAGLEMTTSAVYEIYGIGMYLLAGRFGWNDLFYRTENKA